MAEIETYGADQTLEERIKTLEKANRGLLTDLQSERGTRQSLEERLGKIETEMAEPPSEEDPQAKVNELAKDPDSYISEVVSQAITPLQNEIFSLKNERKIEKAKKWIAKKENMDPDEVEDKYGADLIRIGKERGLVQLDPEEGIKAAWEIYQQERKEKEKQEEERSAKIAGQGTEEVRTVPRTGGPSFTRGEIASMPPEIFNKRYAEIKEAERMGRIK